MKHDINRWTLSLLSAVALAMTSVAGTNMVDLVTASAGQREGGFVLQANTTYTLSASLTFESKNVGLPGFAVPSNSVNIIEVPLGMTLESSGFAASGQSPATPGIYLPESSKLIFVGNGKVITKGGDPAGGQAGSNGGDGECKSSTEKMKPGKGGAGGYGGGGGAPGVGGCGGRGGNGGQNSEPGEISMTINMDPKNGVDGAAGESGGDGEASGQLYVLESVQLSVNDWSTPVPASATGGDEGSIELYAMAAALGTEKAWYAGGGGGGAGGGSGLSSAQPIGCGGPGGGGGGAGGGGACFFHAYSLPAPSVAYYCGCGGDGGVGLATGGAGKGSMVVEGEYPLVFTNVANSSHHGLGGNGGEAGLDDGKVVLYVCARATNIPLLPSEQTCSTHAYGEFEDLVNTIKLYSYGANRGLDATVVAYIGSSWPQSVEIPDPESADLVFAGYTNAEGVVVYNAEGKYTGNLGRYFDTYQGALLLYGKWVDQSALLGSELYINGVKTTEGGPLAGQPAWYKSGKYVYLTEDAGVYVLSGRSTDLAVNVTAVETTVCLSNVTFNLSECEGLSPISVGSSVCGRSATILLAGEQSSLTAYAGVPAIRTYMGGDLLVTDGGNSNAVLSLSTSDAPSIGSAGVNEWYGVIRIDSGHLDFNCSDGCEALGTSVISDLLGCRVEVSGGYYRKEWTAAEQASWLAEAHQFTTTDSTIWKYAVIKGVGVKVDGIDCCFEHDGKRTWEFDPATSNLTFLSSVSHMITGANRGGSFHMTVPSGLSLTLNVTNLFVTAATNVLNVSSNATVALTSIKGTSLLRSTGAAAIAVDSGSSIRFNALDTSSAATTPHLALAGATTPLATNGNVTVTFVQGSYAISPEFTTDYGTGIPQQWAESGYMPVKRADKVTVSDVELTAVDVKQGKGVSVNGLDIAHGGNADWGWTWNASSRKLELTPGGKTLTISGKDINGGTFININSSGTVVLDGLQLTSTSDASSAPITICSGTVDMQYRGNPVIDARATAKYPAIYVKNGAALTLNSSTGTDAPGSALTALGGEYAASIGNRTWNWLFFVKCGSVRIDHGRYVLAKPAYAKAECIGNGCSYDFSHLFGFVGMADVKISGGHFSVKPNANYAPSGESFSIDPDDSECPYFLKHNTGLMVNGADVIEGSGSGWRYYEGARRLVIDGTCSNALSGATASISVVISNSASKLYLDGVKLTNTASVVISPNVAAKFHTLTNAEASVIDNLTVSSGGEVKFFAADTNNEDLCRLSLGTVSNNGTISIKDGWYRFGDEQYKSWGQKKMIWVDADSSTPPWKTQASSIVQAKTSAEAKSFTTMSEAFTWANGASEDAEVAGLVYRVAQDQTIKLDGSNTITLKMSGARSANVFEFTDFTVAGSTKLVLQGYGLIAGEAIKTNGGTVEIPVEVEGKLNRIHFASNSYTKVVLDGWMTGDRKAGYEFSKTADGLYWALGLKGATVEFETNGHGRQPDDQQVQMYDLVENPGKLKETGYYFRGWYADSTTNTPWDFTTDIVTNELTTIYAKWEKDIRPESYTNVFPYPWTPDPTDPSGTNGNPRIVIIDDDDGDDDDDDPETVKTNEVVIIITDIPTNTVPSAVPIVLPEDMGPVTLDLSGLTLKGTNGLHGTVFTAGGDGGPAIIISTNKLDKGYGPTEITVIHGVLEGGDGGNGNPYGFGCEAWTNLSGNAAVKLSADSHRGGMVVRGHDGRLLTESEPDPDDPYGPIIVVDPAGSGTYELLFFGPGEQPHGCRAVMAKDPQRITYLYGEADGPKNFMLIQGVSTNTFFHDFRANSAPFEIPFDYFEKCSQSVVDNSEAGAKAAVVYGMRDVESNTNALRVLEAPTADGVKAIVQYVKDHGNAKCIDFVRLELVTNGVTTVEKAGSPLVCYIPYSSNGVVNVVRCVDGETDELDCVEDATQVDGECFSWWSGKMVLKVNRLGDFAFVNELGTAKAVTNFIDDATLDSLTNTPAVLSFLTTSAPAMALMSAGYPGLAATHTLAANGQLSVAATAAAGLDVADPDAKPEITAIDIDDDGNVKLTVEPKACNGASTLFETKIYGAESVDGEWTSPAPANAHFYKVSIEAK